MTEAVQFAKTCKDQGLTEDQCMIKMCKEITPSGLIIYSDYKILVAVNIIYL